MLHILSVKAGGNFLDESDGTDSTKTNTNSGIDRTTTLTFSKDGDNYTATLYVATADDVSDTDGGAITLTLKADTADPAKYTVFDNFW